MSIASREVRERAIAACLSGLDQQTVAALCGVNRSTIWRWRHQLRQGQGLEAGRPPGGRRKISVEQEALLEAQLREHADATLEEHCEIWKQRQGQMVSRATMARSIHRLGWTRKKSL